MFGKTRGSYRGRGKAQPSGNPWDEAAIGRFRELDRFDVLVTHVEKKFRVGSGAPALRPFGEAQPDFEIVATGHVRWGSPFVQVAIESRAATDDQFGYCRASWAHEVDALEGATVQLPVLAIVVSSDPLLEAIHDAMKNAVVSGRATTLVRVFCDIPKNFGSEFLAGTSNVDSFCATGAICFSELHHSDIAEWSFPWADDRFSLERYPFPSELRCLDGK